MLVAKLVGGLGNQMFQYAAARSLSHRLGCSLYLDASEYEVNSMHQGFELDRIFEGHFVLANSKQISETVGFGGLAVFRYFNRLLPGLFSSGKGIVKEPHFTYWPAWESITYAKYMTGYWQSEKYFSSCSSIIREDFNFKHPLKGLNLELAARIRDTCSISLHVRRGDYVSNPKAHAMHGVCNLDYYNRAIQHIGTKVQDPSYFVFSDDIDWARTNLALNGPVTFVEHNVGVDSYLDMQLMSMCDHHIIANSSFSWWGAWLVPGKDKIVVAPKRWFSGALDSSTLIPLNWIQY